MPSTALLRGLLSLTLMAGLALTPLGTAPVAQSSENVRYAAIVVDATSGEVLFARHADSRRYPASITKVMTLYLAFEAMSEGRIKPTDVLRISPHAASMPPSKLGLAAGQTITLDDAMRATAVRSANDMAVAVAEHIAGSEDRFAAQMTLKARELGMSQTRYVNANGLPDSRQLTSARDLAILARAVMRDYPQYYSYFGLHDWVFNGRTYRNTNGLLLTRAGYDGMKTGYTNASGYNLAASQVSGGKRLVTVVLGGRSTASRNAHVAELMDTGFEVERARERGQTIQVAQAYFESKGFGVGADNSAPIQYASTFDDEEDAPTVAVAYTAAPAPITPPARVSPPPSSSASRPADVTAILNGGSSHSTAAAAPTGRWSVQVGAFRDQKVATDWLTEVNRRFRTQFNGAARDVQNAEGWYRARFTGMTEAAAQAACSVLAERRVTCLVIRPQG